MACPFGCKDGCKWHDRIMPCAVCSKVNGDNTPKPTCYCGVCKSYICKDHWNDPIARGLAAAMTHGGAAIEAVGEMAQAVIEPVKKAFNKGKIKSSKNKSTPSNEDTA